MSVIHNVRLQQKKQKNKYYGFNLASLVFGKFVPSYNGKYQLFIN